MRIKNLMILNALTLLSSSAFAVHGVDIHITNNTDFPGTGFVNSSPCSSKAGDIGIVKPHGAPVSVSTSILSLFCVFSSSCEVHVFLSKDCTGKELGTANVDANKGIVNFTNLDTEHYVITGDATHITVDPVKKSWKDWFRFIF